MESTKALAVLVVSWIVSLSIIWLVLLVGVVKRTEPAIDCMRIHDDAGVEWMVCNLSYKTGHKIEGEF